MRHRATLLAAGLSALVVLSAPMALAQSPEVQRYLGAVRSLYESLEYEKALQQLARAREISRSADGDAAIGVWEGVIRSELGQIREGEAAMRTALSLDPSIGLPVEVSPKLSGRFEELRAEVRRQLGPAVVEQRQAELDRERIGQGGTTPGGQVAVKGERSPGGLSRWAWAPLAGGAVLLAGSGYTYVQARQRHDALVDGTVGLAEAEQYRDDGARLQNTSRLLGGLGGAALVGGLVMLLLPDGGDDAATAWVPGPGQVGLGLVGSF
jgi:hypothetical protein